MGQRAVNSSLRVRGTQEKEKLRQNTNFFHFQLFKQKASVLILFHSLLTFLIQRLLLFHFKEHIKLFQLMDFLAYIYLLNEANLKNSESRKLLLNRKSIRRPLSHQSHEKVRIAV